MNFIKANAPILIIIALLTVGLSSCEKQIKAWRFTEFGFCTTTDESYKPSQLPSGLYETCEDCELSNPVTTRTCTKDPGNGNNNGGGNDPDPGDEFEVYFTLHYGLCRNGFCYCGVGDPTGSRLRLKIYNSGAALGSSCSSECVNKGNLVFNEYIFDSYTKDDRFGEGSGFSNPCNSSVSNYEKVVLDASKYQYCYEVSLEGIVLRSGNITSIDPGDCKHVGIVPHS